MTNALKSKIAKAGLGLVAAASLLIGAVSVSAAYTFTAPNLVLGSNGAAVQQLQMVLNSDPMTKLNVAAGAAGSPGNESMHFGPATKAAVIAFQKEHNISPMSGIVGPLTMGVLNQMGGTAMGSYPAGCTSNTGFSTTTGMSCASNMMMTYPAGCTSAVGYSSTTGMSCATGAMNNAPVGGAVTAMLSTDNPASANVIQGQATADLLHVTFNGSGTVTQMTLQRSGISDNSVFPNVYLYNGMTRLTDAASINSMGQIIFNGLNLVVNGPMTISVRGDILPYTTTGPSESTVMVTLTGFMTSGATAATTTNIAGNSMYINAGSGVLSTVQVGTNTVASQAISAGTTGMSLWSAPLNVSLHPVLLKGAAFDVIGSAPSNAFANLGLYANGVQIATSTGVNAMGYISFDLSGVTASAPCAMGMTGFCLQTGATTLEVRGDVVNGSARSVQLSLQHASDLMLMDTQVGVNVSVTNVGGGTYSINQGGSITINGGSLVAQSDPVFNSTTNVTGGASNVAIASYKLSSYGEDVKINTVTVTPVISPTSVAACQTSASTTGLNNVTLYYNGAPIGSSQNGVLASNCTFNPIYFTPGSNLTIAGGTTGTFQVHADLVNGAGTPQYSTGTITATVTITQYQGMSSGTTVNSTTPLSGSNALTIQTGSLTVAQNAGYLGQTINPNTSGAHIASFVLQNQSTSEAVQVNSLNVGLYTNSTLGTALASGGLPITDFSTLTVSGIPGTVTPIGQPTGTGNTFSTNFQIPAGGSQTIDIFANVGATNGQSFVVSLLPIAVGSNSRVSVTSTVGPLGNGTIAGQTMTLGVGSLNAPSLITSQSTNPQYISSGGTGASNAAQETYNFVATTGTANVIGLKFAALQGGSGTAGTSQDFTTTGVKTVGALSTYTADAAATPAICTSSSATCNFLVTTTGVYGGTNAVVTGYYSTSTTLNVTAVITPIVLGSTSATSVVTGAPSTVYQLATTGATGVALNSAGVATGSATFNGGIAYLSAITGATGTTGAMVPNNPSGVTLPVFVSYGPVNTNGGVASGSTSQVLLEYVQYQTGSNTSYLAPAVGGTIITLVGSKPNITLNPSTAALTNGTSVLLGTVTVAADNTGDIALSEIPLIVSLNAGTSGTPVIVADHVVITDTNGAALANLASTNSAGTTSGTAYEVFGSAAANHYRISAGSSKTFEIHVDFTGSTFGTSATASVSLGASDHFVWDDINGNNVSVVGTSGTAITSGLTGAALYAYPNGSVSIHN